jgi:serine/threonine-protein kinase RsbW
MNNLSYIKEFSIVNQIDELTRVSEWLEQLGEELELPMSLILSLNLVLEEALTNTIQYGYDDESQHEIDIRFEKTAELVTFILADDGCAYDPTLKTDADITLSADERPIGGLGILLMKKIMNTIEYQRKENRNILTLKKIINQ